jgi:hypothetical protein
LLPAFNEAHGGVHERVRRPLPLFSLASFRSRSLHTPVVDTSAVDVPFPVAFGFSASAKNTSVAGSPVATSGGSDDSAGGTLNVARSALSICTSVGNR